MGGAPKMLSPKALLSIGLLLAVFALGACGGGGGGSSSGDGTTSSGGQADTANTWDNMKWDQGQWQ